MAGQLDLDALAQWVRGRGDIETVEIHDLLCSPDGKAFFKDSLGKSDVQSVVVAACSPKAHEKTFQGLAEEAGLNMADVQMANIREQCAWVTRDPEQSGLKARALINAAVNRCRMADRLERRSMKALTDILIVGGGVAGMEAALCAAQAGRKVTVVEREMALGGNLARIEEVAPSMECSPCLLAPRLDLIREHPNIEVLAPAELLGVVGFEGNFTATVRRRARYVRDSCIGCEACLEVCPVDVESPFQLGMGSSKAIHGLYPGAVPAAWMIERDHCKHFTDGSCSACAEICPFESVDFEQQDEQLTVKAGAIVLATGFSAADLSPFEQLGFGRLHNVFSLQQFERMTSNNGPTGGEIRLGNGEKPSSAAVIHCAGSLRDDGVHYCSGICCSNAVKVGRLLRQQNPEASVTNLHNDLVFSGPRENAFYRAALSEGTRFVRCPDLGALAVRGTGEGRLQVSGPGIEPVTADMVVLSGGLQPAEGTRALAELLHLELGPDGFFKPDHDLLYATGASLPGVHLAGCAAGPCDVAASVTRARAAVGDAMSRLRPGEEIELEVMTSEIDEEICAGCKLCLSVCPYRAIVFDSEKNVCRVNAAVCRGCGTCTAACPSGASRARHFTDEQIYAEIGGLMHV
jgi:heterodisulfide reductase subunit A